MSTERISKIKEIVTQSMREDGWTPMSTVGLKLITNGIDIKDFGFGKLKPFFEALNEDFVLSIDEQSHLPLVKCNGNVTQSTVPNFKKINYTKDDMIHLTQWANINQKSAIETLKNMALPERWTYSVEDESYPNPILAKYLKWTFVKLMRENKILYSNEYAAFNTGLVDKFYKPIYAVFDKNKYNKQPWHFIDFCVAGSSNIAARKLTDNFSKLPERASYIQNYDDVIYDTSLPVDVNWEHIILENIDRMPTELLRHVCSGSFEVLDPSMINKSDKINYYNKLRCVLESNPMRLSIISSMMSMAVETAKHRVAWNYKTAIPVYYPTDDSVHLILPLALNINEPEEISIALVMTKTPSRRYRAVTIFTLDMAYSNARLVTKPSSDWLVAESINSL
ncbi:DUF3825 domain-containing protein [Sodaliphilus sp.]|uniref:DUF3825 domain-containing protein n=1 Tax=Sodaliphilus sp. TaxID=2815818 RepID=UPI00388ED1AF